jgi:hypothetical protein
MHLYLPYLLLTLALLAGLYAAGTLVVRLLRVPAQEPYFDLLLRLAVGLGIVASVFALVRSGGRTVLLPIIPLLLLMGWQLRRQPLEAAGVTARSSLPASPFGALLVTLGAAVVLFTARIFLLFDAASPFLRTPFQDYICYARISTNLLQKGLEARSLEFYYPQFVGAEPYHFLELWLNGLLVGISGQPALWCLYLSLIVFVGLRAILAWVGLRAGWAVALAGVLLLTSGVFWPFFNNISFALNGRYVASSLLLLEPKLTPVYIYLLLGVALLLRRQYVAAALALAVLPIVFVATAPAVGVGIGLLALFLKFSGRVSWGRAVAVVLPIAAVAAYIGVFYVLQPAVYHFPAGGQLTASLMPRPSEARTMFNIFVGVLISFGIYFGPFLLILAVLGWRYFRSRGPRYAGEMLPLAAFVLGCAGMAGATRALASHFLDSYQFASNIMAPLLPVALAAVLGVLLANAGRPARFLTLAALLGLAFVNHYKLLSNDHVMHETSRYSPEFLRQAEAALAKAGQNGAYILGDEDYENTFMLTPDSYTAGTYVANFKNGYGLASLSSLDLKDKLKTDPRFAKDSAVARQITDLSSFNRFVKFESLAGRHSSLDSAKLQFVRQHHIEFLVVSPHAGLPATLRPLVSESYRDPLSGEQLYLLNSK